MAMNSPSGPEQDGLLPDVDLNPPQPPFTLAPPENAETPLPAPEEAESAPAEPAAREAAEPAPAEPEFPFSVPDVPLEETATAPAEEAPEAPAFPEDTFDLEGFLAADSADKMAEILGQAPPAPVKKDDTGFHGGNREFANFIKDETPAVPPQPPKKPAAVIQELPNKGRPKRKRGEGLLGIPNMLVTVVWLALIVAIGITMGRLVWICASEVLAFGRDDKTVTVTIYETDTIEEITDKLYKNGLIHYPGLFRLYADFAVDEGEIHPGIWDLNTQYDYHALVKMMAPTSSKEVVKVMIPEGYNCRQVFDLLQQSKVCTALDLGNYAATGELEDYWFLSGVVRGDKYCLEGFLFPDTYEFYKNESPRNVLEKMLGNFDKRFSEELRSQIAVLNDNLAATMRANGRSEDYVATHLFTVRDVVNVASLVEKEMATTEESYTIASVIYNRLFNWGGTPAYLNIDATVIYALGGKTDLTNEDLQVQSPYNTYLNTGLPPTPITNPGLATIQAALYPQNTKFYFYVLDPATGEHHFSTTLEEHEAFRAKLG